MPAFALACRVDDFHSLRQLAHDLSERTPVCSAVLRSAPNQRLDPNDTSFASMLLNVCLDAMYSKVRESSCACLPPRCGSYLCGCCGRCGLLCDPCPV